MAQAQVGEPDADRTAHRLRTPDLGRRRLRLLGRDELWRDLAAPAAEGEEVDLGELQEHPRQLGVRPLAWQALLDLLEVLLQPFQDRLAVRRGLVRARGVPGEGQRPGQVELPPAAVAVRPGRRAGEAHRRRAADQPRASGPLPRRHHGAKRRIAADLGVGDGARHGRRCQGAQARVPVRLVGRLVVSRAEQARAVESAAVRGGIRR